MRKNETISKQRRTIKTKSKKKHWHLKKNRSNSMQIKFLETLLKRRQTRCNNNVIREMVPNVNNRIEKKNVGTGSVYTSGVPREGVWVVELPLLKPNSCFYSEVSQLCKCSTCCYFKTAVTEFAPHHTDVKSAGWCSGKRHCFRCGQGQIQGEEMWGMHLPTSHFQTCFR